MMEVRDLEPKALWNNFADLNQVPRPSKKEEKVRNFLLAFGRSLGLETERDTIGNVVIRKPATPGMENRQPVVLQAHMDMVHQKNSDVDFDFETEGIKMYVDGDWVKAKGTTLGADDGIGVASIMTILAAKNIPHPALEGLITVDEETGMTGAQHIDNNFIQGKILLNLDTEDEDELTIGCAGGVDLTTEYHYQSEPIIANSKLYQLSVKGLLGGHSGAQIHLGRANANKLMNRLLFTLLQSADIQLISLDGGSLRNAIPRESVALIAVAPHQQETFEKALAQFTETVKTEYTSIEKNLSIYSNPITEKVESAVAKTDSIKIINAIYADPNGVYRMSPDIEGFVETSSNLAHVKIKDGIFITESLLRSGVESTKTDIANAIKANFENMGAQVTLSGDYPGWKPNPDSPLVHLMTGLYKECFQRDPKVLACHAGLECGLLGGHFPGMDMISMGPTLVAPHSPDEKVQISSVQRFFDYLLHVLKEIPQK